ncbi:hypothetical protein FA048_18640 [Pedobacter polaris]|uniref:MORN repeat variant n=1 Tax=Pedobacter polaris TaxID=2571273 RepID=A0A4U1CHH6_9SPHI|nr:hypothetical protein [Pedobacter polaris]TKC04707.1 hypothetical protein FA048_18640 [Pedobacter polaris]
MKGKYIFGACTIILMIVFFSLYIDEISNLFYKTFQLSGKYVRYNKKGQIHGEAIAYVNGKMYVKENFANGVKQGWSYEYYENKMLKRKTQFANGKAHGQEFLFDEKGRILESRNYLMNKPYGNWFKYDTLGNLTSYALVDISQNIIFSSKVDKLGELKDMHGFVVSSNFYSFDADKNIINLIKDTSSLKKGIKDLFITVVNVPNDKLLLNVNINGYKYVFDNIKSNTVKIPNIFKAPGDYHIFLKSKLVNKRNQIVNGIDIDEKIVIN